MENIKELHDKVKKILYSLTGITLTENKDIMINNRLDKLKRNTKHTGNIDDLLQIKLIFFVKIFILLI